MEYEINEQKGILDYKRSLDFGLMMKYIEVFSRRYPFLGVTSVGRSVMGKEIPMITLGKGERAVVYVGAPCGNEWLTSIILLRFINEYCELYKQRGRIYNNTLDYVYSEKSIHIVPMLNPDGVDYKINGEPEGYSGTSLVNKPNVGSLCNFLRFNDNVRGLVALRLGKEQISCGESTAKAALGASRSLERMSGYELLAQSDTVSLDRLVAWCERELNIPSFEIKCGEEKKGFSADVMFRIYADLRELLFRFPFVI